MIDRMDLPTGSVAAVFSTPNPMNVKKHRRRPGQRSSMTCCLAMAILISMTFTAGRAVACNSSTLVNHGFRNDLNLDFNDYALIFEEASTPNCAAAAASALLDKVSATLASGNGYDNVLMKTVGPYQGWLEGAHVALIFATALELGGQGQLKQAMDDKIEQIFYQTNVDPYCGFASGRWKDGNTCMDDYAVAAAAWSWMAAYEKNRGRYWAAYSRNAKSMINSALSTYDSVCIYNPMSAISVSGSGPCNAPVGDLSAGIAETVSLNHGNQTPAYGLGLMTSIATAFVGLEKVGSAPSLTASQKTIVMALFEEGQRKSTPNGSTFKDTCYRFVLNPNNSVTIVTNVFCGDEALRNAYGIAYYPKMFPLHRFYTDYGFGSIKSTVVDRGVTQSAYKFTEWDGSFFNNPMAFFGAARKAYYKTLAYDWLRTQPTLSGVLNGFDPIGYLDGIDANGCAFGWTCDQDTPVEALRVDFYVEATQYIQSALANQASEPAVNSLCGGGTAHRFVSCLPAWTKGKRIYAYGINTAPNGTNRLLPGWQCVDAPACRW